MQPDINFGFLEGSRRNPEVDYAFVPLFNNSLHQKIFVNYNVGLLLRKEITQILLSASMSFMHTHWLRYFLEVYDIGDHINLKQISIDGGITYLLKPRLQFDVYIGRQDAFESDRLYVGLGAGSHLDKGDLKPRTFRDIGIRHWIFI